MTDVTISTDPESVVGYRAVAGGYSSAGRTPGEALDRLAAQMDPAENTWIVVQGGGDEFFTAAQHQRLAELKQRFRDAVDLGSTLSDEDQAELDALINQELEATSRRLHAWKNRFAS